MRILISGVNGFVGQSLVETLRAHSIIGIGRQTTSISACEYYKWDIREWNDEVFDAIGDVDIIIHAAASLSIDDDDSGLINTNCMGTYNIYKFAKKKKSKKVFYISGAPIIGNPVVHPINENHPLNPQLMYHATKLAGEYILNLLNKYGIEVVNLRINAPIGCHMPIKSIVPIFVDNAWNGRNLVLNGQGSRKQTYLDVRDLSRVILENLNREGIAGTYIIAGKEAVSNKKLAELCVEISGSDSKILFSGITDENDGVVWDYDCSKAENVLGFSARYSIEDSLKWMISSKALY